MASAAAFAQQYKFEVPREVKCIAQPYCGQAGRKCQGVQNVYRGAAAGSAKHDIVPRGGAMQQELKAHPE